MKKLLIQAEEILKESNVARNSSYNSGATSGIERVVKLIKRRIAKKELAKHAVKRYTIKVTL